MKNLRSAREFVELQVSLECQNITRKGLHTQDSSRTLDHPEERVNTDICSHIYQSRVRVCGGHSRYPSNGVWLLERKRHESPEFLAASIAELEAFALELYVGSTPVELVFKKVKPRLGREIVNNP